MTNWIESNQIESNVTQRNGTDIKATAKTNIDANAPCESVSIWLACPDYGWRGVPA